MAKNVKSKNAIIIVVAVGIIFLLACIIYNKTNVEEEWVVCDYQGQLSSLEETIKFRYAFNRMYGYYEYRTMTAPSEDTKKEILDSVNNFGKDFKNSAELTYKVEEDGLKVKTTFYIKALDYYEFINQYFNEVGITIDSTKEDVINKLGNDYKCKIV